MFRNVLLQSVRVSVLVLALTTSTSVALAQGASGFKPRGHHGGAPIPEIDPTCMVSGLALLTGGALLLTDKIRRKS